MRLPLPAASLAALTLVLALGGCIGEDLAGQVAGNVLFLGDIVPGAAPAPRFAPSADGSGPSISSASLDCDPACNVRATNPSASGET